MTPINRTYDEEQVDETLDKTKDSIIDSEVSEVESGNKLCPIYPIVAVLKDACIFLSTEDGMKYHIMNI